jgi:hypothetical protein
MSYNWPLKDMFTGFDPKQKFNNMTLSYYNKHFRKPRYVFILRGGGGFFFSGSDRSVGRPRRRGEKVFDLFLSLCFSS